MGYSSWDAQEGQFAHLRSSSKGTVTDTAGCEPSCPSALLPKDLPWAFPTSTRDVEDYDCQPSYVG